MTLPTRDNSAWLRELSQPGSDQDKALSDLRTLLIGGLARSFDKQGDAFLEDIAQDSLMKILHHLPTFNGGSQFTTWAMSIAVRTALSELRHKRWSQVSLDEMSGDSGEGPSFALAPGADPAQQAAQENVVSVLHRLIQTELTTKQRTALLAEVGGMPLEEIARKLGNNLNATYKLLHDARKRLKTALEQSAITASDIAGIFSA